MVSENALNIFRDDSSLQSPCSDVIGISFLLTNPNGEEEVLDIQFIGHGIATNNQMEFKAFIIALNEAIRLQLLHETSKVNIQTDFLNVVDNYMKAMFPWPKTRWHSLSGRSVLNANLLKQLISSMQRVGKCVEFKCVKGQSKSVHNRTVDKMASQSASAAINDQVSLVHVQAKLCPDSVEIGSVPMQEQGISIRVMTTEYLRIRKVCKNSYGVISKRNKDF